ncbi:MAG: hypothetical protein AB8B79_09310 [Granulosicoccus sp.]
MPTPLIYVLSLILVFSAEGLLNRPLLAQTQPEITRDNVQPMGQWFDFRQARYGSNGVLLHLRTGYERAVLMPEPIELKAGQSNLPGCDIEIDSDVIGFYPTRSFKRQSVEFIGLESGTVYVLKVRSSTTGIRQPLQISR